MDEMNEELRKMIESESSIIEATSILASLYKGFVEAGMPEKAALDLVKFWMGLAFEQLNSGKG